MRVIPLPAKWMVLPVYKRLISFYPTTFRQRFEEEMLLVFQDKLAEEPESLSTLQKLKTLRALVADLVPSIVQEHTSEWRNSMNITKFFQGFSLAALAVWLTLWAWYFGKWFLLLPLADPVSWLPGGELWGIANSIYAGFMFLVPLLTLLTFLVPAIKVQIKPETGDAVVVRLTKMGKSQVLVVWGCLGLTVTLWGMVITSRLGWW
ncbi:MAG: hypothetical protein ACYC3H_00360 [Bellilinea sp.]